MEGEKNKWFDFIAIILAIVALVIAYKAISYLNQYQCEAKQADQEAYNADLCGLESVECPGESVDDIIRSAAQKYGVREQLMIDLAYCESRLDPQGIGDKFMPKPSVGLFQISLYYHPEVSREQALDPVFASEWTAKQIKAGRLHLWSCSKIIAKR